MHLCICASVHLCICVSVYLCICASVHLCICVSVQQQQQQQLNTFSFGLRVKLKYVAPSILTAAATQDKHSGCLPKVVLGLGGKRGTPVRWIVVVVVLLLLLLLLVFLFLVSSSTQSSCISSIARTNVYMRRALDRENAIWTR